MQRNQELIDRIKKELDLPNDMLTTDDEIWFRTKGSLMAQRIAVELAIEDLKREIRDTGNEIIDAICSLSRKIP